MTENTLKQNNESKRLLLIGNWDNGKSTIANFLLKNEYFTTDNLSMRTTREIRTCSDNGYLITVCPKFGDKQDNSLFFEKIINCKDHLLENSPYDALAMIVKMDFNQIDDKNDSTYFYDIIKVFVDSFGKISVKSLLLIFFQDKTHLNKHDFDAILKKSDGYLELKRLNDNVDIPYVLWEDSVPVNKRLERLTEILNDKSFFKKESMEQAFELIEKLFIEYKQISDSEINHIEIRNFSHVELVLGSADDFSLNKFLSYKKFTKYDEQNDLFMDKEGKYLVYVNCKFYRFSFNINEFKANCEKIRSKLSRIYLLQNLNPRPETLDHDMNILSRVFTKKELSDNIQIYFTGLNDNLESFKDEFVKFNCFFDTLGIKNKSEKLNFASKNIFKI